MSDCTLSLESAGYLIREAKANPGGLLCITCKLHNHDLDLKEEGKWAEVSVKSGRKTPPFCPRKTRGYRIP